MDSPGLAFALVLKWMMLRYAVLWWFDDHTKGKYMTTSSYESLSHSRWDCKYHVVFIPKRRKKVIYGKIREFLRQIFHELAKQKGCEIISGSLVHDHVHMLVRIASKYSVAEIVGYIKGKSVIAVARKFSGRKRNFNGECFWARGYSVSTVGYDEENIRVYIKNQEQIDDNGHDSDELNEF